MSSKKEKAKDLKEKNLEVNSEEDSKADAIPNDLDVSEINLNDLQFQEFMLASLRSRSSPSLQQIAVAPEQGVFTLEQSVKDAPVLDKENESDLYKTDYNSGASYDNKKEEREYAVNGDVANPHLERVDFQNVGKDLSPSQQLRKTGFVDFEGTKKESEYLETTRTDFQNIGKKSTEREYKV